jgi:hypothetical protein
MHTETKFSRRAFLGLTSQDVFLRLSNDTSALSWRVPGHAGRDAWAAISGTSAEEFGEIALTSNVATVRLVSIFCFTKSDIQIGLLIYLYSFFFVFLGWFEWICIC